MVDWLAFFWHDPEVIERYSLPEPSWVVGAWDASACAVCSSEASQFAEITCSRGPSLLCSGPVVSWWVGGWVGRSLVGALVVLQKQVNLNWANLGPLKGSCYSPIEVL